MVSSAQTPIVQNRVTVAIDDAKTIPIHGTITPLVRRSTDVGRLSGSRNLGQMLLMLSPTKEQDAALEALIEDLHTPSSAKYHHWLKPAQVGARFGISDADAGAVKNWLESQGFEVKRVAASRRFIVFSGTVMQVESAFHTEMHEYSFKGQTFIANSREIQIPSALSAVVRGVVRLSSTPRNTNVKVVGKAAYDQSKHQITFSDGEHAITPADFATIYNLNPLYQNGINGAGQSIAIVARSNFNPRDVLDFFALFGIPFNGFFLTINGDDPGPTPDAVEATLDITWAMALAPGSTPNIVISQSNFADGTDISAAFIVDNDLAPVMSASFSLCEQQMGPVGTQFYYALWAQAAAEGITPVVSTGDSGGAECDDPGSGLFAQNGLAVSGIASTPFNVAVGGTEFDDTANPSLYWFESNDPTTKSSARSYIPEKVWNESSIDAGNVNLFAGGGGVSTLWPKPNWQIGPGVPNDGMRDIPDVSLNAAGHDGYVLCLAGSCENGQIFVIAGTSASAPSFAAVMVLLNQQTGSPQGTPNFVLYQLAAQHPDIFHDITVGDNKVPDANGNFTVGYPAGPGYDLATGLGSFDANALVTNWGTIQFSGTSVNLVGPAAGSSFVHGAGVPVTATVTGATSAVPTGNVAFFTDNPLGITPSLGVGVGPLDNTGTLSTSLKEIPGGTHTLTARYAGDAKFLANTSNAVNVTVTPEPSTTFFVAGVGGTIVQSAQAKYGEPLTMAVLVQGNSGVGHPTGIVNLNEGANLIGSRLLNFGEHENTQQGASSVFGILGFPVGLHTLNAMYPGDPSFNASTSADFLLTITKSDSNFSSLHPQGTFVPNVAVPIFGQISLTSGALLPISGTVTFSATSTNGSVNLGSATLEPNSGTFAGMVTLPSAGSWILTAAYSGDSNVNATQTQSQITVDSTEATTLTLTSSLPTATAGTSVTFTAQVSSSVVQLEPTGTVTFMDGSSALGTATLDANGIGKFATTSLGGGAHTIIANYGGDAVFRLSSASINQMISDYSLQAVTASVTIAAGQSGKASLAVIPQGGFNQAVTFSCSGLPTGASCSFAPPSITPDGTDIASDTMTISAGGAAAAMRASTTYRIWPSGFGLAAIGAFLFVPTFGRRRAKSLLLLIAVLLLIGMLGCGGSSSNSNTHNTPPPVTSQVTVTATTASGVARTATVSVTITQ
ncbi:MAG TPA: Ig-like domain repeat protein [Candidatus Sulfotelmatobacter sp.]|nr:Ig-like domain repeat protein [Candidatus Sulfotelmatobacter sp.]